MEDVMKWKLVSWWGMRKLSSFRVSVRDHGSPAPLLCLIGAVGASPEMACGWVASVYEMINNWQAGGA